MAKEKKPTMMEVKKVITNLIIKLDQVEIGMNGLDMALSRYIEFKGDKDNFIKHIGEENKKNESRSKKSGDGSGTTGSGKTG